MPFHYQHHHGTSSASSPGGKNACRISSYKFPTGRDLWNEDNLLYVLDRIVRTEIERQLEYERENPQSWRWVLLRNICGLPYYPSQEAIKFSNWVTHKIARTAVPCRGDCGGILMHFSLEGDNCDHRLLHVKISTFFIMLLFANAVQGKIQHWQRYLFAHLKKILLELIAVCLAVVTVIYWMGWLKMVLFPPGEDRAVKKRKEEVSHNVYKNCEMAGYLEGGVFFFLLILIITLRGWTCRFGKEQYQKHFHGNSSDNQSQDRSHSIEQGRKLKQPQRESAPVRRRRGSRRANRESQGRKTAHVNVRIPNTNTTNNDGENAVTFLHNSLSLCSGKSLLYNQIAINVKGNDDECPVCLEHFGKVLADTYCCVLPCKHACCMPCLRQVEATKNGVVEKDCPICRVPYRVSLKIVHFNLYELIKGRMDLLTGLPLLEKIEIFNLLLESNRYQIHKADQALEDMLIGSIVPEQALLGQHKHQLNDWTPEQKQAIFEETQRPVTKIQKELSKARKKLRNSKSKLVYEETRCLVEDLEKQLIKGIHNAREDAYNQINSRGGMGVLDSKHSTLQVDYHALRKEAAMRKFDELVVPILPVTRKVHIITGKGKHSQGGKGVLKQALKDHIDGHKDNRNGDGSKCFCWEPMPGNDGVVRVVYVQDKNPHTR